MLIRDIVLHPDQNEARPGSQPPPQHPFLFLPGCHRLRLVTRSSSPNTRSFKSNITSKVTEQFNSGLSVILRTSYMDKSIRKSYEF